MRLLRQTIRCLLVEGKVEDLQKKYLGIDVAAVAARDRSSTKKYLPWMLKQLASGVSQEDLYPSVEFFDKNTARMPNKDINSYKTLKDLEDAVKATPEKSKKKQREETKSNAPKLYEDDTLILLRPDTKGACITYGAGTRWCITMEDASYYEEYTSQNVVFYYVLSKVLPQKDPMSKVAFAVIRDNVNNITDVEVYDAEDKPITYAANDITDMIEKDATSRPMSMTAKLKNGLCTKDELTQLVNSDDAETRRLVAGNKKTPPELLDLLCKDTAASVKVEVADNPNTWDITLNTLSEERSPHIGQYVAAHKHTPVATLVRMSKRGSTLINLALGHNPNTPLEALTTILDVAISHKKPMVIPIIAAHPNASLEMLEKIADSFSEARLHGEPPHVSPETARDVNRALAANPNTPTDILEKLAGAGVGFRGANNQTVEAVAGNPNTSPETLLKLTTHESPRIRYVAGRNPSTPRDAMYGNHP